MDRKPPQTGARLFAAITERASAHPVSVLPPLVTFWPIGAADSDPDGFAFARQGTFLGGTEEGLHLARKAATDKKNDGPLAARSRLTERAGDLRSFRESAFGRENAVLEPAGQKVRRTWF